MGHSKVIRSIRLSETVSPFGPGAVVDILGESFMAVTGDHWPKQSLRQPIECERLASKLDVAELWSAPSTGNPESPRVVGLDFIRFPSWLFCQACRRMIRWTRSMETGYAPVCPDCDERLVPMRFISVCTEHSHVSDVPWPLWLHRPVETGCTETKRLRFSSAKGKAFGLAALEVECLGCGTIRSLGDLRADVLAREGVTCTGTQPWEYRAGTCGKPLDVQQRGATSLHFGDQVPAIDIPEVEARSAELEAKIKAHAMYFALQGVLAGSLADMMLGQIAADLGTDVATVASVIPAAGSAEIGLGMRGTTGSLLAEEFEAFIAAIAGRAPTQDFVTRPSVLEGAGPAFDALSAGISDVVLVDRLREVRAAVGFRRHRPDATLVPAVPREPTVRPWLPAVEGYGEGIFLRFDGLLVDTWATRAEVQVLADQILVNQAESMLGRRLHEASAQYLLLHSFAHVLMRELAFSSGYSAPSLRERIYCERPGDYGVFIYTTTSDIEGTLGGLVRQGEPNYLADAIARALELAAWCPNDPVCSESEPQSIDGLNLAACHACMLAPETSCESFNLLLDRTFLTGSHGFFEPVIRALEEDALSAGAK